MEVWFILVEKMSVVPNRVNDTTDNTEKQTKAKKMGRRRGIPESASRKIEGWKRKTTSLCAILFVLLNRKIYLILYKLNINPKQRWDGECPPSKPLIAYSSRTHTTAW